MRKYIYLICFFLIGFSRNSNAQNTLGTELTYKCVSPNTYQVQFRYVRDCEVLPAPNTIDLALEATGCNAGRIITLNRTGPPRTLLPYCPYMPVNCLPNGPRGPEINIYSGILTFSAAEQTCPDWKLAITVPNDNRALTANLVGNVPLYTEAYINLRPGINNNSAEYTYHNFPFVTAIVNQNLRYYLGSAEQDGDSLVYSLISARQAAGTPVTYQSGFSGQNPVSAASLFTLDSVNGLIQFNPSVFFQTSNRYVVVVQVNEYREINGQVQLVGRTQKDFVFEVFPPTIYHNAPPQFKNFTVNGQLTQLPATINVTAGQTIQVHFETSDADTADYLYLGLDLPYSNIHPFGPAINIMNNGLRPSFDLVWTPNINEIDPVPYRFSFRLEDTGCPVNSTVIDSFKVKVSAPTGLKEERAAAGFAIFPNPFTDQVSFKFNSATVAREIRIYNLLGQEIDVVKVTGNENEIRWEKASNFASGTYVAKLITSGNAVQTLKFSKLQ